MSSTDQRWLDTEEAARHLRLAPATLERWRVTGDGPKFAKLGRRCIYARAELDRFVDARMCSSTSDVKGASAA
ncbi:helix-turn-helix transcriptional regulator [Elioraea sp.]|uniref:helix-turn-helix transcriptional regulator n=1 Tax=Elioraea sp. TaxID=2185103 RepID=UPI003F701C9F